MSALIQETIPVSGVTTRVLRGGGGGSDAAALVFIHGGVPGVTPYANGTHIWGDCLTRFAGEGPVIALDLPGSGGTMLPTGADLSIGMLAKHVRDTLNTLGISRAHLVGHDIGGVVALDLACDASTDSADAQGKPNAKNTLVAAVSVVASVAAAPTGDGVENLTFAHPPPPLWGRDSQQWALERISYSHHHIDAALLNACVAAAQGAPHSAAMAAMAKGAHAEQFAPSLTKAKMRFYEITRGAGLAMPVQVIWGTHDPLGTIDHGMWLYRIVAKRQAAAHFHLINRAGALPFREEPDAFHQVLAAFHDATARQK